MRTVGWIIIVVIPVILFILILTECISYLTPYIGVISPILFSTLSWFTDFMSVSLPSVLFLASLTVTYLQKKDIDIVTLSKRFPMIDPSRKHIPRWKNIRTVFQYKKILIVLSIVCSVLFFAITSTGSVQIQSPKKLITIAHRGDQSSNM